MACWHFHAIGFFTEYLTESPVEYWFIQTQDRHLFTKRRSELKLNEIKRVWLNRRSNYWGVLMKVTVEEISSKLSEKTEKFKVFHQNTKNEYIYTTFTILTSLFYKTLFSSLIDTNNLDCVSLHWSLGLATPFYWLPVSLDRKQERLTKGEEGSVQLTSLQ
jgi:hypothetical protein